MSDSDDTDILLLIPPDFFAIHLSDSETSVGVECCFPEDVVHGLIAQLSCLENRMSIIESKESLSTPLADKNYQKEDTMFQQPWHDTNQSPPRSLRASSLPPTPSANHPSGAPTFYRTNSYPSPSKSAPITPDNNNYASKNSLNRKGPLSPSVHVANEVIPHDLKVRYYVSQLSNHRDTKQMKRPKNSDTMREIDSFFESLRGRYGNHSRDMQTVGTSPRINALSSQVHKLGLEEVDQLLEKVEADQVDMEAKLSARERQFGLPVREVVQGAKQIQSFPGDSISSVPDLNLGVRKLWDDKPLQPPPKSTSTTDGFGLSGEIIEEPCVQKKFRPLEKDISDQRSPYHTESVETQTRQAPKVFQSRRRLEPYNSSKPDIGRLPDEDTAVDYCVDDTESAVLHGGPMSPLSRLENNPISLEMPSIKTGDSASYRGHPPQSKGSSKGLQDNISVPERILAGGPPIPPLMSLAELWGEKKTSQSLTLEQRLEEEKYRREHCESLVQSLQTRLLEVQQRLAVAQRVDSEKDSAINHLHSTWTRIMDAWKELEEERDSVASELEELRSTFLSEKEQLCQKLAKCEGELSKALDLAHGYQEQSQVAEKTRIEQLEHLGEKVKEVERRLDMTTQANSETQARNTELQVLLDKECEKNAELERSLTTVKESLTKREADVSILTEEKRSLQTRLKEERARADTIQQSRDSIRKEAEEAGKRERALQGEVKVLSQQLSSIRSELRDFYQEQLERAVRDKLAEFQSQLDTAEAALHKEAENRELAMAEIAARQLKLLNSKHRQEVALLEKRHAEQLHLAQLERIETERTTEELRKRLEEYEANASNLAQRLHGIMQNQWREALTVVSGPKVGKSESKPAVVAAVQADRVDASQMDAGQSWLLVKQQEQQESRRRQRKEREQEQYSNLPSLSSRNSPHSATPFEQEGILTQRSSSVAQHQHQGSGSSGDSGEDLKKYIKMLLDRAPGKPFEASTGVLSMNLEDGKMSDKIPVNGRDSRNSGGKPPWK